MPVQLLFKMDAVFYQSNMKHEAIFVFQILAGKLGQTFRTTVAIIRNYGILPNLLLGNFLFMGGLFHRQAVYVAGSESYLSVGWKQLEGFEAQTVGQYSY